MIKSVSVLGIEPRTSGSPAPALRWCDDRSPSRFVDAREIDPIVFSGRCLYLLPESGPAHRPYLLLAQAMRRAATAAWLETSRLLSARRRARDAHVVRPTAARSAPGNGAVGHMVIRIERLRLHGKVTTTVTSADARNRASPRRKAPRLLSRPLATARGGGGPHDPAFIADAIRGQMGWSAGTRSHRAERLPHLGPQTSRIQPARIRSWIRCAACRAAQCWTASWSLCAVVLWPRR